MLLILIILWRLSDKLKRASITYMDDVIAHDYKSTLWVLATQEQGLVLTMRKSLYTQVTMQKQ